MSSGHDRPIDWVRCEDAEICYKSSEKTVRQWSPEDGGRRISITEIDTPYGDYYRTQLYDGWERYDSLDEAVDAAEDWMEECE